MFKVGDTVIHKANENSHYSHTIRENGPLKVVRVQGRSIEVLLSSISFIKDGGLLYTASDWFIHNPDRNRLGPFWVNSDHFELYSTPVPLAPNFIGQQISIRNIRK